MEQQEGRDTRRERSRELFARLARLDDHDPDARELREALVELHLPLVTYCARRFVHAGRDTDEITQAATLGLIHAVDRFDPGRGVEFTSFATPTILGEIKRHLRDTGWALRIPRRLHELRLDVDRATEQLAAELGRSPRPREIGEHIGTSEETVLEVLEAAQWRDTLSLDSPVSGQEEPLVEQLGQPDHDFSRVEARESLGKALSELPEREQQVLVLRFVRGQSQTEIARQVGVSQVHVSRLLTRSLEELRTRLQTDA